MLPPDILSWSPLIESACVSVPVLSVKDIVTVPPLSVTVTSPPPTKFGVPLICEYDRPVIPLPSPINEDDIAEAVTEPKIELEPVTTREPLTRNSPVTTEAVTIPCICLLLINVAIITYSLFYLLHQNHLWLEENHLNQVIQ